MRLLHKSDHRWELWSPSGDSLSCEAPGPGPCVPGQGLGEWRRCRYWATGNRWLPRLSDQWEPRTAGLWPMRGQDSLCPDMCHCLAVPHTLLSQRQTTGDKGDSRQPDKRNLSEKLTIKAVCCHWAVSSIRYGLIIWAFTGKKDYQDNWRHWRP